MVRTLFLVLALCTLAAAEDWTPPENKNAALVYWRAFNLLVGGPSDEKTETLIRQVCTLEAPWDESLSAIVDQNRNAVLAMHRGSKLADCSFGLDYEDGAAMMLPHLTKARTLARMNVLYARRLLTQGLTAEAVDALLCGVRFSDHLWRDGTLINGLVAKAIFSMQVRLLIQVVGEGKLDDAMLGRIDEAMRKLPPYAFDWGAVLLSEKACFAIEWERILSAADPKSILDAGGMFQEYGSMEELASGKGSEEAQEKFRKEWGMEPTDLADPEKVRACVQKSREDYHTVIAGMGAAMRGSYVEAAPKIAEIEGRQESLGAIAKMMIPALGRTNEQRAQVEAERAGLIALVTIARHRASKGADPDSLDGLDVPTDPFTGKAFELAITKRGMEVRSEGKDGEGKPIVFRMAQ